MHLGKRNVFFGVVGVAIAFVVVTDEYFLLFIVSQGSIIIR
jgi:hypothetical protein